MTWRYVQPRNRIPLLLTVLFLLWVYGLFWWAVAAAAAGYLAWSSWKAAQARQAADAETAARADWQHRLAVTGDQRGIYGDSYTAMQDFEKVTRR